MKFNLTLVDPPSYKFAYMLSDMCRAVAGGLRSLGHTCDLSLNSVDQSATNIIFGTHLLGPQDVDGFINTGARYIAVQSEWLSLENGMLANGFQGTNFEATYRRFYEKAIAVWDSFESNVRLMSRFDIAPSKFKHLWLGYHADLEDIRHRPPGEKDIDALFFGSITPRREQLLRGLQHQMRVVGIFDAPPAFRNDLIARAKLHLALHSSDALRYCSFIRIGYLANNRAVVVSEPWQGAPDMRDLVIESTPERLLDTCCRLLGSKELDERAIEAYERYRQMPMTAVLEPMLDQ